MEYRVAQVEHTHNVTVSEHTHTTIIGFRVNLYLQRCHLVCLHTHTHTTSHRDLRVRAIHKQVN